MADKRIYELTEASTVGSSDVLALDSQNMAQTKKVKVKTITDPLSDKNNIASLNLTGSTNTSGGTIEAGRYFYLNGDLVKAKTDIAAGATFTAGTNYVLAYVGTDLAEVKQTLSPIIDYDVSEISFLMNWEGTIFQPAVARGITSNTTLADLITGILIKSGKNTARYIITTNSGTPSTTGCPTLLSELGAIFGSTVNNIVNTFVIDVVDGSAKRSFITHYKGSTLIERCFYGYNSSAWSAEELHQIDLINQTSGYKTGDEISFAYINLFGVSNVAGTEINFMTSLPKTVTSSTSCTISGSINWVRGNGTSITTGLSIKDGALQRPNSLQIHIQGTFSPLTLYTVDISNLVATVN